MQWRAGSLCIESRGFKASSYQARVPRCWAFFTMSILLLLYISLFGHVPNFTKCLGRDIIQLAAHQEAIQSSLGLGNLFFYC